MPVLLWNCPLAGLLAMILLCSNSLSVPQAARAYENMNWSWHSHFCPPQCTTLSLSWSSEVMLPLSKTPFPLNQPTSPPTHTHTLLSLFWQSPPQPPVANLAVTCSEAFPSPSLRALHPSPLSTVRSFLHVVSRTSLAQSRLK